MQDDKKSEHFNHCQESSKKKREFSQKQSKNGTDMISPQMMIGQKEEEENNLSLNGHRRSYEELTKYQRYLEYRLKKIFVVKQILLEIIRTYQGLHKPSHLSVSDIHLFIFLLDVIEYLINFQTIKTFGLQEEQYPKKYQITLHNDSIELDLIKEVHRHRLQQLKHHYFTKINLINQKFLISVEQRTSDLLEWCKSRVNITSIENVLQEISSLLFPAVDNIRTVYSQYLFRLKSVISSSECETMVQEELRLFYLWGYLINFHANENDHLSHSPSDLVKLKHDIFHTSREQMMHCSFDRPQYDDLKKQLKKE